MFITPPPPTTPLRPPILIIRTVVANASRPTNPNIARLRSSSLAFLRRISSSALFVECALRFAPPATTSDFDVDVDDDSGYLVPFANATRRCSSTVIDAAEDATDDGCDNATMRTTAVVDCRSYRRRRRRRGGRHSIPNAAERTDPSPRPSRPAAPDGQRADLPPPPPRPLSASLLMSSSRSPPSSSSSSFTTSHASWSVVDRGRRTRCRRRRGRNRLVDRPEATRSAW